MKRRKMKQVLVVGSGDVARRIIPWLARRFRVCAVVRRPEERAALQVELEDTRKAVRAEKISEIAAEFDGIHSIHRAVEVGSVDKVISAAQIRPAIIETIEAYGK